tara:strand:- start:3337 stop:3552 length:216 start_codon:yes stop_codon:yes gene_type:complete
MDKKKFLASLNKIFERKVSESTPLNTLNFDSLKILDLIALKESKFKNSKINPEDYIKCINVKDILNLFGYK